MKRRRLQFTADEDTGDTIVITQRVGAVLTGRNARSCDRRTITFRMPPVRTDADMTVEERAAIERQYGCRFAKRFGE